MQSVVVVIARLPAGSDQLRVPRVLVHGAQWRGAGGGVLLNVPGVRMADGSWAVLLALPFVLATAVGTSAIGGSVAGSLWLTALLTAAACHGPAGSSGSGPRPCRLPLASQRTELP